MIQILPFVSSNQPGVSGLTEYQDILSGLNTAPQGDGATRAVIATAGTLRNLDVELDTPPGAGDSYTFTLRLNGADTGITGSIANSATTLRVTGVDVAVVPGDYVNLKVVSSGSPAASGDIWGSIEFESTNTAESLYGGTIGLESSGSTRYEGVLRCTQTPSTTPEVARSVMPCSGTFTAMYSRADSAPGGGDGVTLYINKNGVRQDGTGGTVNTTLSMIATAAANTTFTLPVVAGDLLYLEIVGAAFGGIKYRSVGYRFVADTDGQSMIGSTRMALSNSAVARYFPVPSFLNAADGESTDGTATRGKPGISGFSIGSMSVKLETAPGGSLTRTFTLRRNGTDTGLTLTITGAGTTGSASFQVDYADGDTFNLKQVASTSGVVASNFAVSYTQLETVPVPPTAVDDTYTTPYGTTLTVSAGAGVLANDVQGTGGDFEAVLDTDVDHGTLTLAADGSFVYVPSEVGYVGAAVFTYHATTTDGDSATATVTITITREITEGGGEPGEGTNPPSATVPTGVLRVFFRMQIGEGSPAVEVAGAETTLRDPASWHGGKKKPTLISISPVERELTSDGSFRGTELRVVVADTDRTFRTLAATSTLCGSFFEYFVVSDEVRYALGEPYRLFAGLVHSHQALPGFKYELVVRDILSDRIADLDAAPRIPPDRLSVVDFPGMDAQYEGRAVPLVLGFCSDEAETGSITQVPQGVIPPVILGQVNFTYWGGIDQAVIACVWSSGALVANGIWSIYYNPLDTPDVRILIPLSSYGVDVWTPGMPGWADTGLATDYVDYPLPLGPTTRRYTPFFVRADQPLAQAFIEGKVLVAANLYGGAENADGTGRYLSDAPRIWQWLIVNQLFTPYKTGDYAAIPLMDGAYSIIDTDSVETSTQRLREFLGSGGDYYPVGFMLGRDGSQQTLRHILGELCAGVLMEQGLNRHGQLMVDVEDVDAVATVTLTDLLDIADGEFSVWIDQAAYRNRIEYVHGFRYVAPSAPPATPAEGEPLPARPLAPYHEWTSGLRVIEHTTAVAAFGGRQRTLFLENYVVRDGLVAENVAARLLQRLAGPSPAFDGPRMFRLTTSWQGLQVELGTVIAITHVEGMGATGYEGTRGRVTKISVDGQAARITIEGRILDDLGALPDGPDLGSPA